VIYRGLAMNQRRVEALETIMLDDERKEEDEKDLWRNSARPVPIA
jgi:hypothetical protein